MGRPDVTAPATLLLYDPLSNRRLRATADGDRTRTGSCQAECAGPVAVQREAGGDERVLHYFVDPRSQPAAWNLELTHACTWSCRHCYVATVRSEPWETDRVIDWGRRIKTILACNPKEISLSGGEVLLLEGLADLLGDLRARAPAIPLRILLMGMASWRRRAFRELVPALRKNHVLAKIPLYSSADRVHDWVTRSAGALADSLETLNALQQEGVTVEASCLLLKQTADDAIQTVRMVRDLVGERLAISTLVYPPRIRTTNGDAARFMVNDLQMSALLDQPEFASLPVDYLSFQPRCASGCRFPCVLPDGNVLGCAVWVGSDCGNAQVNADCASRASAWSPSQAGHGGKSSSVPCEHCELRPICKQCLAFTTGLRPLTPYCHLVRCCVNVVRDRIRRALAEGFAFLHRHAELSWESLRKGMDRAIASGVHRGDPLCQ